MMNPHHEKINLIVSAFGMSAEVQAKAMNISRQSVYNKHNLIKDKFNEKNYLNLVSYINELFRTIIN